MSCVCDDGSSVWWRWPILCFIALLIEVLGYPIFFLLNALLQSMNWSVLEVVLHLYSTHIGIDVA